MLRSLIPSWLTIPCYLCGSPSNRHLPLCIGCEADLPFNHPACLGCGLPFEESEAEGQVCQRCYQQPFGFSSAQASFLYEYPINNLIKGFKYQGKRHYGKLLSQLCTARLGAQRADFLIPMPLSKKRMKERGFNQSLQIAKHLGKQWHIPIIHRGLYRKHKDAHQAGASRSERFQAMQNVFTISQPVKQRIEGKNLIIIDDVMTTGASAEALADSLFECNAETVKVICLARTPANRLLIS